MPAELINILFQLPALALFAWFVIKQNEQTLKTIIQRDQEYREAQAKRDDAYIRALADLTFCIKEISQKQDEHYSESKVATAILMDRIGRPKATRPTAKE